MPNLAKVPMPSSRIVHVVDDEEAARRALGLVLCAAGYAAACTTRW
jgi:FixJ family two-component response regulator